MVQDTSAEVYYGEIKDKLGDKQKHMLGVFEKAKRPVCNQEIANHLGWPINTVTPRVNELVTKGLVQEYAREIYPETGRRVIY